MGLDAKVPKVLGGVLLALALLVTIERKGEATMLGQASGGAPACNQSVKIPIVACPSPPGQNSCIPTYTKYMTGTQAFFTTENTTQCPMSPTCSGLTVDNYTCNGCVANCNPANYPPGIP